MADPVTNDKCPDCGAGMTDGKCPKCGYGKAGEPVVKNENRTLWNKLTKALDLRGFFSQETGVTDNECVTNSEGVCVNCGGVGGKPGPCPVGGKGSPGDHEAIIKGYHSTPTHSDADHAKLQSSIDSADKGTLSKVMAGMGLRPVGGTSRDKLHKVVRKAVDDRRYAAVRRTLMDRSKPSPIKNEAECVLNSDGVCVNCGGKGGKPGPCGHGESHGTGMTGAKFEGMAAEGNHKGQHAEALSAVAQAHTRVAETTGSKAARDKAVGAHNDAATAHRDAATHYDAVSASTAGTPYHQTPIYGGRGSADRAYAHQQEAAGHDHAAASLNHSAKFVHNSESPMSKEALDFLSASKGGTFTHNGKTFTYNCEGGKFEEVVKPPVTNEPMTDNEWLAKAPPGIREGVANALEITAAAEKQVRAQLTAVMNAEQNPEKKGYISDELAANPGLKSLQKLLVLVAPAATNNGYAAPSVLPFPQYFGPVGYGPTGNAGLNADGSIPDMEATPYSGPIADVIRDANKKAQ